MLKTRVLSGIALVIILGSALYVGGYYLWTLLLFASLMGQVELYRALHGVSYSEHYKCTSLEIAGIIETFCYYISILLTDSMEVPVFVIITSLIADMIIYVLSFPKYRATEAMQTYFAEVYVPVMLGFIYLLGREHGFAMTLLIFISSWVCDTFAYFSGRALGKHKLAPILSPKKSIEGAVGGVIGSAAVGALFACLTGMNMFLIIVISAAGAVVSQFGDLFASAIKRNHNIKDYGNLIPGHGGILDRFDSVIITAPIIYILSEVLLK
ncbi:MAG: phosphatidate cytidylyltransferase [Lachnospiraceae bacterium]|nr:phosphatidate cytidylyltransferase [Lachnospiraceae bacterium]